MNNRSVCDSASTEKDQFYLKHHLEIHLNIIIIIIIIIIDITTRIENYHLRCADLPQEWNRIVVFHQVLEAQSSKSSDHQNGIFKKCMF